MNKHWELKKYSNRKLYLVNTRKSVSLKLIYEHIVKGGTINVVYKPTKANITDKVIAAAKFYVEYKL